MTRLTRSLITVLFLTTLAAGAFADSLTITNKQGTVTADQSGVSMFQSQLLQYNGQHGNHSMGYVSFTTGALLTGSVLGGGTFSSVGSTFEVVGQATGHPARCHLLTGRSSAPSPGRPSTVNTNSSDKFKE